MGCCHSANGASPPVTATSPPKPVIANVNLKGTGPASDTSTEASEEAANVSRDGSEDSVSKAPRHGAVAPPAGAPPVKTDKSPVSPGADGTVKSCIRSDRTLGMKRTVTFNSLPPEVVEFVGNARSMFGDDEDDHTFDPDTGL
uniref:Uncharacterized protein n=1 Tax=Strombidinopsis acuminata TaxID=141414 RepID=A0A7S3T7I9_9SPIT|mmetsp:Transcript_60439/g.155788  ORF Transcript_60439/g.155788 Transcript_60439/m.155788 type:complete len:143 (-) Transcript_60439:291-719(-)